MRRQYTIEYVTADGLTVKSTDATTNPPRCFIRPIACGSAAYSPGGFPRFYERRYLLVDLHDDGPFTGVAVYREEFKEPS